MDKSSRNNLNEVRQARNQAEVLRDQLQAEYDRLREEDALLPPLLQHNAKRKEGLEAMRKAIKAANRAIESIDQALREMGWVDK